MKSRKINNLLNIKSRKNKIKNNSTRRENFSNNNNKTLKNKQEKCEEENINSLIDDGFGDLINNEDPCSINNISLQNNTQNIKGGDIGNDNEYNPGF